MQVSRAARDALCALWAACVEPIPRCLESCYGAANSPARMHINGQQYAHAAAAAAAAATSNAHFVALVRVSLRPTPQRTASGTWLSGAADAPFASPGGAPSSSDVLGAGLARAPPSPRGRGSETSLELGGLAGDAHRVPLVVLALCKLGDPSADVRAHAEELLHAYGAAADELAPPSLIAHGLPWSASHAQRELSERLAASRAGLAPAVVSETLWRAAVATVSTAHTLLAFLTPWAEHAALSLLVRTPKNLPARGRHASSAAVAGGSPHPPPPAKSASDPANPPSLGQGLRGACSSLSARHSERGAGAEAEALMDGLLGALVFHSTAEGHAPLAPALHALWRALATHEASVEPLVNFLLRQLRERVPLQPSGADASRTDAAAVSAAAVPSTEAATASGLLHACQAAMLAISSVQPAACARLLAEHLAPVGCTERTSGEHGEWQASPALLLLGLRLRPPLLTPAPHPPSRRRTSSQKESRRPRPSAPTRTRCPPSPRRRRRRSSPTAPTLSAAPRHSAVTRVPHRA